MIVSPNKISKSLLIETIKNVRLLIFENYADQKYYLFVNNWDGLRNYYDGKASMIDVYETLFEHRNKKLLNVIKVLSQNPDSGKTALSKAHFILNTMVSVIGKKGILDFTEEGIMISVVAINEKTCLQKADEYFRKIYMPQKDHKSINPKKKSPPKQTKDQINQEMKAIIQKHLNSKVKR